MYVHLNDHSALLYLFYDGGLVCFTRIVDAADCYLSREHNRCLCVMED